jgi:hypothetical protein
MENRARGLAAIVGLVAFTFASPVFGQQATVDFTGIINTQSFGGGYADPYAGTVTYRGSTLNSNGEIVCDDYYDEIYLPETWTATVIQASSLTSADVTATLFGSSIGINGYAAVAGLINLMYATTNQSTQDDLSAAIWWLTSGGTNIGTSSPDYVLNGYTLDSGASAYVSAALAAYGTLGTHTTLQESGAQSALAADTSLYILNPVANSQPSGDGRPQEMWVTAPEGGGALLYLLLAGASCFGAIYFNSHNRFGNRASARF